MDVTKLEKDLIEVSKKHTTKDDPSHDFGHILRVFKIAKQIGLSERADLDILIPSAIFHDIIVYPKHDLRSQNEADESAEFAVGILKGYVGYPEEKIEKVKISISNCSFRKNTTPDLLEARILQDADRLDATGATAIMRTFSSSGQWKRPFYDEVDPFCKKREFDAKQFTIDLFYTRLLVVGKKMNTKLGKKLAKRRDKFLESFLNELDLELKEINRGV